MKALIRFRKNIADDNKALPVVRYAMNLNWILLLGTSLFCLSQEAAGQKSPVFLSTYDSCHMSAPMPGAAGIQALSVGSSIVRVAYVIPSNRTPQPNGVASLQNVIRIGQQYYKDQMEQNGFGAKSYTFETEADGITPLIHVVNVSVTDDFIRGDVWGRTIQAASDAGLSIWAPGEVWVLMPEAHLMQPDGTVAGGVALGSNFGSGNSPGVAMIGSQALPLFQPAMISDDTPYDGKVVPEIGPFPMKQDVTFSWFEGNTFSSITSSYVGAMLHEMGHAFGLAHDTRNDNNFHGNLMFNGLRGIRGNLYPQKYPDNYTRLEYASALILNVSHYFNSNLITTSPPIVSYTGPETVTPQQGLLYIEFQASDNDMLSLAHLRYKGDAVAELSLEGNSIDTAFATPYYTQGEANQYTIAVHDKQGNTTYGYALFSVSMGNNQAPFPFIRIDPPVPGLNQPVILNASLSNDIDSDLSSVLASWDVDNDGQFDTEPGPNKTFQYLYQNPGNYLVRLKLIDPAGAQTISTAVSVRIPGEKKIAVESFTLINPVKGEDIKDLQDGMVIDLTKLESKKLNVRANTNEGKISHVTFDLRGPINHHRKDKSAPYSLFGDTPNGNYLGRKLIPGEYTLTATPFLLKEKGIALKISFKVIRGNPEPTIAWDKTIGGTSTDMLDALVATSDGGYLLGGHSGSNAGEDKSDNSRGGSDYWIVRLDAQHNKLWDKTYGGIDREELRSLIATPDGGYLLGGYSTSRVSGDKTATSKGLADYWVIKIDNQGNMIWDKSFGGDRIDLLIHIVAIPEGGYLLAGHSDSHASGDKSADTKGGADYWLVKIDEQGNKIWDKTFGGGGHDELRSVNLTNDGFLLTGSSDSYVSGDKSEPSRGSTTDYWVIKINNQGDKMWDKTFGGNDFDGLTASVPAPDGGYVLVGLSNSNASWEKSDDSKGAMDGWIVKIDANGNKVWDKTYGGNSGDDLSSIVRAPEGGYLLAGSSASNVSGDKSENSRGSSDFWAIRIDNLGNKAWDKTIGGSGYDFPTRVIVSSTGNYLLAGYSDSNASSDKTENSRGAYDYWIVEVKEPNNPGIKNLMLVNAFTDKEIKEIKNGDVIRLNELGTRLLDIRANVSSERVTKVAFDLTGPINYRRNDKARPFVLFGDHDGDFLGQKLVAGNYTLKIITYVNDSRGSELTISFEVSDGFAVKGFTLVDATLNKTVGKLSEGDVIDLSLMRGRELSVRADTEPKNLEKVVLTLQGPIVHTQTEKHFPYTLFGDTPRDSCFTDYAGRKFVSGTYSVRAVPYSGGIEGEPFTITFEFIKGGGHGHGQCRRVDVFPLPASDFINIVYEGKKDQAQLTLLDFNGHTVLSKPLSQQPVDQVDVRAYGKGIYYLKIITPEDVQIIRVVIE